MHMLGEAHAVDGNGALGCDVDLGGSFQVVAAQAAVALDLGPVGCECMVAE